MSTTAAKQYLDANNSIWTKKERDASHSRDVNNRRDTKNGENTRNRRDVNSSRKQLNATQQHECIKYRRDATNSRTPATAERHTTA